jgi:hypothetical protein
MVGDAGVFVDITAVTRSRGRRCWWLGSNGYMMVVRIQRIYDGG